MIADEVQSGLARTGKMLACDWEEVRPDVVVSTPSPPLKNSWEFSQLVPNIVCECRNILGGAFT